MKKSVWLSLVILFASTLCLMTSASARGPLNYLGRMFGVGWSDGYHAQDGKFQNRGYPGCGPESVPPMFYQGPSVTKPQTPILNRPVQPTPAIPRSQLPPGNPVRPQ